MITVQAKKGIVQKVIFLACIMLPFELIFMQGIHSTLSNYLPFPVAFLHPSILLAWGVYFLDKNNFRSLREIQITETAIILLAIPAIIHSVNGSMLDAQFLFLGVGAVFLGCYLIKHYERTVVLSTCFGVFLWSLFVVLLWAIDVSFFLFQNEWARTYSFDRLILAIRYPESIESFLLYPIAVGNWNKAANVLVLGAMMLVFLGMRDYNQRGLVLVAMPSIAIMLVLSFSRGGMLVMSTLGMLMVAWHLANGCRPTRLSLYSVFWMIFPLAITVNSEEMRLAWFDMSSTESRVRQISDIIEAEALVNFSSTTILIGSGTGTYGTKMFGYSFAGTHNLFIDTFLAGGVIQLIGLLILFFYPMLIALLSRRSSYAKAIGGLSVLGVMVLSMREFDLNYLGVSAFSAFLVGCFVNLATSHQVEVLERGKSRQ